MNDTMGVIDSLNKTVKEDHLDLAILRAAVGHTVLNVESMEDELSMRFKFITIKIYTHLNFVY